MPRARPTPREPEDDPFPLGDLVREARGRAGLSVRALAETAGVHASFVSRVERGLSWPSREVLRDLLEACGMRFEVAVGPLEPIVLDPRGVQPTELLATAGLDPVPLTNALAADGVPYRLVGALAAVLQGLPMAVTVIELLLSLDRLDEAGLALEPWLTTRWHERWCEFAPTSDRSPAYPGPFRWETPGGELRAVLVPRAADLGASVEVRVEHDQRFPRQELIGCPVPAPGTHSLQLLPLSDLARGDPRIGRRLARAVSSGG
jgi:transcriptional regulator with XRE-family HTH domain